MASQSDQNSLIQNLPTPFVVVADTGALCYANPAADRLLAGDLKTRLAAHLRSEAQQAHGTQVRFPVGPDRELILKIHLSRIQWQGRPALLASLTDVSAYIAGLRQLRSAHLRHVSILKNLPAATYVTPLEPGATTPYLSPAIENLLGHPQADWRQDPHLWRKFIPDDERDTVLQDLAGCIRDRRSFVAEYRIAGKTGDVLWLREEASVATDEHGTPPLLVGILLDISEQKRAEELEGANRLFQEQIAQAARVQEELKADRAQLEEELQKRAAELAHLNEQVAQHTTAREKARHDHEQLTGRIAELTHALNDLTARHHQLETTSRDRIAALDNANQQLQQKLTAAAQAQDDLKAARNRIQKQSEERIRELEDAGRKIQDKLVNVGQALAQLKKDQHILDRRLQDRTRQLNVLNIQLQEQATLRSRLRKQNRQLRDQLAQIEQPAKAVGAGPASKSPEDSPGNFETLGRRFAAEIRKARDKSRKELSERRPKPPLPPSPK